MTKPNLFERATIEATGCRELNRFQPSVVKQYDVDLLGPTLSPFLDEYELKVTLGVRFKASRASLVYARAHAERVMLQRIHGGVLAQVAEIRHAVSNGDPEAVLAACLEIEGELGL